LGFGQRNTIKGKNVKKKHVRAPGHSILQGGGTRKHEPKREPTVHKKGLAKVNPGKEKKIEGPFLQVEQSGPNPSLQRGEKRMPCKESGIFAVQGRLKKGGRFLAGLTAVGKRILGGSLGRTLGGETTSPTF